MTIFPGTAAQNRWAPYPPYPTMVNIPHLGDDEFCEFDFNDTYREGIGIEVNDRSYGELDG